MTTFPIVAPVDGGILDPQWGIDITNAVNDHETRLGSAGWTPVTPTWSSSGTQPAIGNGSITGRYRLIGNSIYLYEFQITMGSTTTFGTGTYFVSIPVVPNSDSVAEVTGPLYMLDFGTLDKAGVLKFEDNTKITPVASSGGVVTSTNPHTWANGDKLKGVIIFGV